MQRAEFSVLRVPVHPGTACMESWRTQYLFQLHHYVVGTILFSLPLSPPLPENVLLVRWLPGMWCPLLPSASAFLPWDPPFLPAALRTVMGGLALVRSWSSVSVVGSKAVTGPGAGWSRGSSPELCPCAQAPVRKGGTAGRCQLLTLSSRSQLGQLKEGALLDGLTCVAVPVCKWPENLP